MTNFALNACGNWKAGQPEKITTSVYVVIHDQNYYAYAIEPNQYEDFAEWVYDTFASDNDQAEAMLHTGEWLMDIDERLLAADISIQHRL